MTQGEKTGRQIRVGRESHLDLGRVKYWVRRRQTMDVNASDQQKGRWITYPGLLSERPLARRRPSPCRPRRLPRHGERAHHLALPNLGATYSGPSLVNVEVPTWSATDAESALTRHLVRSPVNHRTAAPCWRDHHTAVMAPFTRRMG